MSDSGPSGPSCCVIDLHEIVLLLQIIIKDINIKRQRCIFVFFVSGFEIIALHGGVLPCSIVQKHFSVWHVVENDRCQMFYVQYKYNFNENNTIFTVHGQY